MAYVRPRPTPMEDASAQICSPSSDDFSTSSTSTKGLIRTGDLPVPEVIIARPRRKRRKPCEEPEDQLIDRIDTPAKPKKAKGLYRMLDSCQLWSILSGGGDESREQDEESSSSYEEAVSVVVEAAVVFNTELPNNDNCGLTFPQIYGSSFVGVVERSTGQDFPTGMRVAAFTQWNSSSRYATVSPERLFPVPNHLDPADVASLITAYLPAFQTLHHGRPRPHRYSRTCLKRRRLLILGEVTIELLAMIRLARLCGANEIYVTSLPDHRTLLEHRRVILLPPEPADWLGRVEGYMDLVIDYTFPFQSAYAKRALNRKGRLVSVPRRQTDFLSDFLGHFELMTLKRATLFDFTTSIELYPADLLQDLNFLLRLLSTRTIRPEIDRFISLSDIPEAYREVTSPSQPSFVGTIICEPSRM